jgi:hypothetical protein
MSRVWSSTMSCAAAIRLMRTIKSGKRDQDGREAHASLQNEWNQAFHQILDNRGDVPIAETNVGFCGVD